MTYSTSNYKFYFYLGGITLAGLLLRLNHLGTESITADEVSALLRLQFNSFGEMLNGGVKPDGHPAFTQVLLWFWIKVFGNSEFAIRLPFVLMGTASIWLAGTTTRRWFGIGAGLAVAASLAFLQFTIMYSQLARPYAPGLFFTMLAAYFVSRFSQEEKVKLVHILGFAVAGAGAAYSHYFSLLTTLLLGIAGIFLAAKSNRTKYLLACGAAVLLFIPHIGFTISQMAIGGIGGPGGWLGAPTPQFFSDHLFFIFNSSRGILILIFALAVTCLVFNSKRLDKRQIVVLLLWLLPMITGYYYSIYANPVLQNSVLLFSTPFLLMFIFSWMPYDPLSKWSYRFALIVIIPLALYITAYKPFHLTDHFGRLKELVVVYEQTIGLGSEHGVDAAFNVDANYFLDYYGIGSRNQPLGDKKFLQHTDLRDELNQLRKAVQASSADYFVYGWSTRESSPASLDIIAERFPCLIEKHEWFNSAVYVFGKNKVSQEDCPYHSTIRCYSFMNNVPSDTASRLWKAAKSISGNEFRLDSANQFGPVLTVRVGDVLSHPDNEIILHASVFTPEKATNCVLVVEYLRDGKSLLWTGENSVNQIDTNFVGWQTVYFGQRPPIPLFLSDSIRAYVFSPALKVVDVRNLVFMTREGHRGIYGIRPDYE